MQQTSLQRLEGKVTLVTGAGAGIGEQICYRFAAEGGALVAMDRDPEALARVAATVTGQGGRIA
ncbi:MAG: SDR family NAD(P)-dependent oxidoreductase, partial [Gammaproteobacteria bacterium]|nr:SDR family NAD(P)-dependent oxidoreductase [Gammaproteobacteria bacterium]